MLNYDNLKQKVIDLMYDVTELIKIFKNNNSNHGNDIEKIKNLEYCNCNCKEQVNIYKNDYSKIKNDIQIEYKTMLDEFKQEMSNIKLNFQNSCYDLKVIP